MRAVLNVSPRYALFALRLGTFLFGVFFLCYHLIYEESKKHTDGMEYLSDWTILFLCATEGALAFSMFRTEKEPGALTALTSRVSVFCHPRWPPPGVPHRARVRAGGRR